MKIANIVINVVLAAAIVVLFIFQFSGDEKKEKGGELAASAVLANPGEISIAYFNMDSVMANWELYFDLQQELGLEFHEKSRVVARGHVAVAVALKHARVLIQELNVNHVLIAATDSLLVGSTLAYFEKHERLLTSDNSNGFIPGEAGAALVIESGVANQENQLVCQGADDGGR